jgi:hypothetical protein
MDAAAAEKGHARASEARLPGVITPFRAMHPPCEAAAVALATASRGARLASGEPDRKAGGRCRRFEN